MNDDNLPLVPRNSADLHIASEVNALSEFPAFPESDEQSTSSGLNVKDVFFTLLRHKWKIIFFGLVGIAAAAGFYFAVPPVYQSQAKLLVRYVVDRTSVDGLDTQIKTPTPENHALINSEVEILTSEDLVSQVAEAVGVSRLTAAGGYHATVEKAIEYLYHNLEVSVVKDTNIIAVTFTSSDPDLPPLVVQELIKRYFDKHLEVHRSTGVFDIVAKETATLKQELSETQAELRQLKEKAGIISLSETKSSLATELGKTQQDLDSAEADLAAQRARVQDLTKSLSQSESKQTSASVGPVSPDIVQKYQSLVAQLTELQKAETELLSKFTPQNPIVRTKTALIQELEKQRNQLEKQYPGVLDAAPAAITSENGQTPRANITAERAILAGLESKVAALSSRMTSLQDRMKTVSEVAPRIAELETKAELEETNYKHSEASLEKARVDETLDPSRMPNISTVQAPTPATQEKRNIARTVMTIAGGGFALGIGMAFLIELILDTTIKRPLELEKRLRLPLLITIPYLSQSSRQLRLRNRNDDTDSVENENEQKQFTAKGTNALFRPFCEAIRDRLGVFFEVNNMAYKPKLVGVTGLGKSAGASTIASGLASAFSEFAEGKVLLVSKPTSTKRFYDELEQFKRSDLHYVIFDMASLGETSSTLPLARFMDTVLLVVEAEKSNREAVKRAYAQLSSKTRVSVIFNKSRSYGPKWLEGDF